jgi:catechol 2,3-dioxygenase-like lactoylglutathione lyase family enzyme
VNIRRVVPDLHGDPAASRRFYEAVIGMEVAMDLGWVVGFRSRTNEAVQVIVMSKDATAPVNPDVSIEVDDVDAVHARAIEAGYEVVHPLTDEPWGVRRFFVRDPNGAVINVVQHRVD